MINQSYLALFDELLLHWQAHKHITNPPPEPILLWHTLGCHIFIDDNWGPAIPYPPIDHQDGHQNYGYEELKGNTEAVSHIPEVEGWPELEQFLMIINAANSPLESAGCEKHYFPAEVEGKPAVNLGSYVDVIFSDAPLNDTAENHLLLASLLAQTVKDCDKWWGCVELSLHRFRRVPRAELPWGLIIRVNNHGRTEEEARKYWGETLRRLGITIAFLPRDLQWTE